MDAKPEFVKTFLAEWDGYRNMLETQLQTQAGRVGRDLDTDSRSKLSDEQQQQLQKLKESVQHQQQAPRSEQPFGQG